MFTPYPETQQPIEVVLMFDGLSPSLTELDKESRMHLATLLSKRNDYLAELIKLNELRVVMLTNPSPTTEEAVNDFNSTVVAPLRDGMSEDVTTLMESAFDLDGLKRLMPMVVMGLLQSINLTLALTILGLEPDMVEKLIGEISKFVKSGM